VVGISFPAAFPPSILPYGKLHNALKKSTVTSNGVGRFIMYGETLSRQSESAIRHTISMKNAPLFNAHLSNNGKTYTARNGSITHRKNP